MIKCELIVEKIGYDFEEAIERVCNDPEIEIIDIQFTVAATTSGGSYEAMILYKEK